MGDWQLRQSHRRTAANVVLESAAMTILITGATGFVGRHLVPYLAERGHTVLAGIRAGTSVPEGWIEAPRIRPTILETGAGRFEPHLKDVQTVVHLAGLSAIPRSGDAEAALQAANVDLTGELVAAAKRHSVRRILHLSSIRALVGATSREVVDDETAPRPAEPYGRSKLQSELLVADFTETDRLAISLRPPLVIGADAKGNWQRLQKLAASNASLPFAGIDNRRSYLAIGTLCSALAHLAEGSWAPDRSGAYCLADPDPQSLEQVVTALRSGMGRPTRLFRLPGIEKLQGLPVVGATARSLLGDLAVDASHFFERFDFRPSRPISAAIAASGLGYLAARHDH